MNVHCVTNEYIILSCHVQSIKKPPFREQLFVHTVRVRAYDINKMYEYDYTKRLFFVEFFSRPKSLTSARTSIPKQQRVTYSVRWRQRTKDQMCAVAWTCDDFVRVGELLSTRDTHAEAAKYERHSDLYLQLREHFPEAVTTIHVYCTRTSLFIKKH